MGRFLREHSSPRWGETVTFIVHAVFISFFKKQQTFLGFRENPRFPAWVFLS